MKKITAQFKQIFFVVVLMSVILISSQAKAESISVQVFNKDGAVVSLSKVEILMLTDRLPNVKNIIAHLKESAYGGGATNLYISFQTKDGKWKDDAAQINGNMPISQHILNMFK